VPSKRTTFFAAALVAPVLTVCTTAATTNLDLVATAAAATVAQVSSSPAQTIQNIGASGAWWVNDLVHFSAANQQRVAALLFSSNGIQLSSYRYNIGGGGVGVQAGERAPQTLLTSPGHYDWTRDPGGTTFLRYASQNGVPDIIGFVNSAPAAWTTNGKTCGGSLKSDSTQAYATYLADIVTHFAGEGVKLDYVSPMNEPVASFSACNQEGMAVPTSQRDDIVRAVGQTLASRAPSTRVIADESDHVDRFLSQVPQWISQPGTAQYVAALAHHTYDFPGDATLAQIPPVAKKYGKPTWATEICCWNSSTSPAYGAQYDPTITGALTMASIMFRDFTVSGDSAFQWWTALSKVMGCAPASNSSCATTINGKGYNDGLIYYDPNYASNGNQNLYLTRRFYALGQYSKFVRPGSVRHPVTGAPNGVQVMATSLGGDWTLVVNNLNTSAQAVSVRLPSSGAVASAAYRTSAGENMAAVGLPTVSAGTASLQLPAQSITTYVFHAG
jgi:O-glycosyl hydrolase